MKRLILGFGVGLFLLNGLVFSIIHFPVHAQGVPRPELFSAICSSCDSQMLDVPAITIQTNSAEAVATGVGYTNLHVTVTLRCPICAAVNDYQSEIMHRQPFATHLLKPRIPHRQSPPLMSLPPLPPVSIMGSNDWVRVYVPVGYELRIVRSQP